MIDYEKIVNCIHEYADELNVHTKNGEEKSLYLLIGYIYGICEGAYTIELSRKIENEKE